MTCEFVKGITDLWLAVLKSVKKIQLLQNLEITQPVEDLTTSQRNLFVYFEVIGFNKKIKIMQLIAYSLECL